jgi:hypothetical protein
VAAAKKEARALALLEVYVKASPLAELSAELKDLLAEPETPPPVKFAPIHEQRGAQRYYRCPVAPCDVVSNGKIQIYNVGVK